MPKRFNSLEDRLTHCSSWVQQTFSKLERTCRESGGNVTSHDDAKCEGRLFRASGCREVFCRLDPKIESIGVGFSNRIREVVAQTGRLRQQRNMAWITLRADGSDIGGYSEVTDLVRQANEVFRSTVQATNAKDALVMDNFRRLATLHWNNGGAQFRLDGDKDTWKRTRSFIYVWFDGAAKRCLNVGHTGLTFSERFGSYLQWLNGKRKKENDRPIRRAWLSCFATCKSGYVEVWVKASAEDIKRREADERHWIAKLKPILNRR